MYSEFPLDHQTIEQILNERRIDGKVLEDEFLEMKSYWQVEKKKDEKGNDLYPVNSKIKNENLRDLCGMANNKGGVMLIGLDDEGELLDSITHTSAYVDAKNLQQTIENHIKDEFGEVPLAVNFRIKYKELEKRNRKKTIVFRIDVAPAKELMFFHGGTQKYSLPVRTSQTTQSYDAKKTHEYSKKRWRRNKLLEEKISESVPDDVKEEYMEISKLFEDEKFRDVTRRSYTLMKGVLHERYTRHNKKYVINKLAPILLIDFSKFLFIVVGYFILIGWMAGANLTMLNFEGVIVALFYTVIGPIILTIAFARDVLKDTKGGHWTPGSVKGLIIGRPPPSAFAKAVFYNMALGKNERMEIEHLIWALVLLDDFNIEGRHKNKMYFGLGFGDVIYELVEQEESVRERNETPDEYIIQYILHNIRLMLNSLYKSS